MEYDYIPDALSVTLWVVALLVTVFPLIIFQHVVIL